MNLDQILELEQKNREEKLKNMLRKAKEETRQDTFNACISIISSQITLTTMAAAIVGTSTDKSNR